MAMCHRFDLNAFELTIVGIRSLGLKETAGQVLFIARKYLADVGVNDTNS